MPVNDAIAHVRDLIEWAALGIKVMGVVVIVAGVLIVVITRGTIRHLLQLGKPGAYESNKHQLGKTLLLGLEFLVAGDVVRTVALEPTFNNVGVLGLLMLIRTFLKCSLTVEIEGRWPWQRSTAQTTPTNEPEKPSS